MSKEQWANLKSDYPRELNVTLLYQTTLSPQLT